MEHKGPKINFNILKILTWFLLGFLSAMIIFLFGLKTISSIWGALLGLCINIAAGAFILKKLKNKAFNPLAYGIISASVILVIAYFSLSAMILALFNGVAS
jgi:hypothetical protein